MIRFTHDHWKDMMSNCSAVSEEFSTVNTRQDNECSISQEEARSEVESQATHNSTAAPQPAGVDTWSYVQSDSSSGSEVRSVLIYTILFVFLISI